LFVCGAMCGIFAYVNYKTPKKRSDIIEILLNGKC
jgi:hypothetical protein